MLKGKFYIVSLVCLLPIILVMLFAGRFLVLDQKPVRSDVIIVLSGGSGRLEKAIGLFRCGYASYIILSNADEKVDETQSMQDRAKELGIPNQFIIAERNAESTLQNAAYTKELMNQYKFNTAIVVTSDYHMRRTKLNFERAYQHSGINLTYSACNSFYNAKFWWADRSGIAITIDEYIKFAGNAFGFNGSDAKRVLNKVKL